MAVVAAVGAAAGTAALNGRNAGRLSAAAITAVSSKTKGLQVYEVIPIALVAAAVSTATGIRDQETTLATEAVFMDGGTNKVVAQVVRKGTGKPLENDSQVMQANDVKAVIDGWASDLHQSYLKIKSE